MLLAEVDGTRSNVLEAIRELVRSHYVDPRVTAKRLAALDAPKTADLFREHLPTRKKARSGDLGEALATEIAEQELDYHVPIRRLRWKDGREMALRGDDIIGIARKKDKLRMLKASRRVGPHCQPPSSTKQALRWTKIGAVRRVIQFSL